MTKEPADGPHRLGPYEYVFHDDPDRMVSQKAEPWYTRWARDAAEIAFEVVEVIRRIKEAAKEAPPHPQIQGSGHPPIPHPPEV